MVGVWCLCVLTLIVNASSMPTSLLEEAPTPTESPVAKISEVNWVDLSLDDITPSKVENFLYEIFIGGRRLKDRTWRINRKALIPILVGLAIKAVAITFLTLGALSIVGSIAILFSKTSLAISAIMFLRRFFSHDSSYGGFFGLNPLNYPHGALASQDHHGHAGYGAGNRRIIHLLRGRSNKLNNADEVLRRLEEINSKYDINNTTDYIEDENILQKGADYHENDSEERLAVIK